MRERREIQADNFLVALSRLHAMNDAVLLPGGEATPRVRVMLRNDPSDEAGPDVEEYSFDVSLVIDGDDTDMCVPMRNDVDLICEDDCTWIVDTFTLSKKARKFEIQEVVGKINDILTWTVCHCGEYLIKDGCPTCISCLLTNSKENVETLDFCAICQESTPRMLMSDQPCCHQKLHPMCLKIWVDTCSTADISKGCPLCRTSSQDGEVRQEEAGEEEEMAGSDALP